MEDWTAPKLLETTGSYWQGCAIMAGIKLDLFNSLNALSDSSASLANRIGADPRALKMLLRALTALGLLDMHDDKYDCNEVTKRFLVTDSPQYMGNIISHQHHLMDSWARLDQSVTSGKPLRKHSSASEDEWRESFLLGMRNLANLVAPQLVPQINIGQRTTMIDLGGGPGTWSIHFCRYHPNLHSTIFDLPTSRNFALSSIKEAGLDNVINFTGGDFNQDSLPGDFDLVWMSHILHGESQKNCQALINKAAQALRPGGLVIIHEFILDDQGAGPVYPSLFALNMLLGTECGAAYTQEELTKMCAEAGLTQVNRLELPPQSRSGILIAQADGS